MTKEIVKKDLSFSLGKYWRSYFGFYLDIFAFDVISARQEPRLFV